jgi:membrane protease YdiL (CAAX protease family)
VDNDLSKNEIINTSFLQYQLVGVGEEMMFRGVIQQSLFDLFSKGFSKGYSRWGSIITASAIFGFAHTGTGFTASPEIAFAAGIYLGMVYHPADGDFDLTQPIAIHSWWDTILEHRRLSDAKFVERKTGENAQNYILQASRTYPLFGFNYRF